MKIQIERTKERTKQLLGDLCPSAVRPCRLPCRHPPSTAPPAAAPAPPHSFIAACVSPRAPDKHASRIRHFPPRYLSVIEQHQIRSEFDFGAIVNFVQFYYPGKGKLREILITVATVVAPFISACGAFTLSDGSEAFSILILTIHLT